MLYITNTLSGEKELFKPLRQEEVKVYFCGPTPYNYAHIGNLKTYMVEDMVIKTLRFLGYKVKTTMNITDIDDKTIKNSMVENLSLKEFTQKYSQIFLSDMQKLGNVFADNIVPISTLIDEMVMMINGLIQKGYAYLGEDGSIYYEIKKFNKYGNLAHLDFSGMKESVRINNDDYDKEEAADFALWKSYKDEDGPNFWEGQFVFGNEVKVLKGRPGWHIECSACNLKYFGAQIDIHMGGIDNIFPHHQNEIAQSEGYTEKTFSKYWIHSGHITVEGKKMAKRLNNFYTLKDLEEKYSHIPNSVLMRAIRICFLNAKYRENVDFSFDKLEQNIQVVKRIDESLKKLAFLLNSGNLKKHSVRIEFRNFMQNIIADYIEKLEDDFNMPETYGVFFSYVSYANTQMDSGNLGEAEAQSLLEMYKTMDEVLTILDYSIIENNEIPKEILEKLEQRNEAKKKKDFVLADSIRKEIELLGYQIKDDRNGVRLERNI